MGKVKVKIVGDETAEKEQLEEQRKRREAKSASGGKRAQVKGVGLGGGQRISTVGVSEEDITKELERKPVTTEDTVARKAKKLKRKARVQSKRYTENVALAKGQSASGGKKTTYPILAGIEMLRKFKSSRFDETVELHINTKGKGISGQVALPYGTGKKLRIKIADDALIAQVEQGKINFDVLVATPDMMPKFAKVAKILGPRGLMPNPKAGTISINPEQVVEKLSAGQVSYKTESAAPIIHMSVGKLSFEDDKLSENIQAILSSIGEAKISSVTLKSTMSPAIRINIQ